MASKSRVIAFEKNAKMLKTACFSLQVTLKRLNLTGNKDFYKKNRINCISCKIIQGFGNCFKN